MSCPSCNKQICQCGCISQIDSKCVFYRGNTLSCLGITTGAKLSDILVAIDKVVCDIEPPSGHVYNSSGCAGYITVTPTTVGNLTNYSICLDSGFITHISNIDSSISTLTLCCANSIKTLSTNTPANVHLTNNGGGDWSVDYISPSGHTVYDQIIYNNLTKAGTTGAGGTQLLKSFNWNYTVDSSFDPRDEVRFRLTGQIAAVAAATDTVIIELNNPGTGITISTTSFASFNGAGNSSWIVNGTLTGDDIAGGTGLLTLLFDRINVSNGTVSDITRGVAKINEDITGIDYSNLTIRVKYVNTSLAPATNNFVRQFMVEVRKYNT